MSFPSTDTPPQTSSPETIGFRTVHVVYGVSLIASYAATWGTPGAIFSLPVLGFWAFVFYSTYRPRSLLLGCIFALVAAWILMPTTSYPREAMYRSTCKNNLKKIMLALDNYHQTYGAFPPAFVADENGKPMHSWRVLLLPFVDQAPLYREYDFDKPWDNPENLKLLDQMPDIYACPSHHSRDEKPNATSYVAVVGPNTAWQGSNSTKLSEFKDGTSNTIMLVEFNSENIPWTTPRDVTLNRAVDILSSTDTEAFDGHRSEDFFHRYYFGRHVALADGSVQFAPFGSDRKLCRELLILNDGQPHSPWDLRGPETMTQEQLKWANVIRFTIAAIFTLLPFPWVWLHPRGIAASSPP